MTEEFKTISLELKAVDGENANGEFEAILSTPDVDRDGESIASGAFNPLPKSIPVHFSHDFVDKVPPVGRAVPFYEGDVLKCRGVFASTPRAQELRALVNEGVIDSMSAGFLTSKRKGKSILSADLIEGSLTATPVNRSALLLRSKSLAELEEKAGARNSSTDAGRLQQIHDLAVENGAQCEMTKDLTGEVSGSGMLPEMVHAHTHAHPHTDHVGEKSEEDIDTKATFTDKERQNLADEGAAMPDGSFPIRNAADLKNAIQAIGRAKDRAATMAHIKKRAQALGLTNLLPDDWKSLTDTAAAGTDEVPAAAKSIEEEEISVLRDTYALIAETA